MITISIPEGSFWDPIKEEFITVKAQKINLEHSLVSLSKWESKWEKPFLSKDNKTNEEILDYIRCMTITPNVDPNVYAALTMEQKDQISEYIGAKMTATWFAEDKSKPPNREIITSEIIYYWMISFNIPFECQKWHLNRLITLIRVCEAKNKPPKTMGKQALLSRNKALNDARRKAMGTKG